MVGLVVDSDGVKSLSHRTLSSHFILLVILIRDLVDTSRGVTPCHPVTWSIFVITVILTIIIIIITIDTSMSCHDCKDTRFGQLGHSSV